MTVNYANRIYVMRNYQLLKLKTMNVFNSTLYIAKEKISYL